MDWILIAVAVYLLFQWLARGVLDSRTTAARERRSRRIEAKLDLLLQAHGIEPLPSKAVEGLSEATRAHADAGRKIAAIKQHRAETGTGLKAAKEHVEEYLVER